VISFIFGENSFENERVLARIVADFSGDVERVDGEMLDIKQVPDLLMGISLFAAKRLVVIKALSINKAMWGALPDWVEKVSDDIHVVLVEEKPDKRSRTFKTLQKASTVYESKLWTDRDAATAERWVSTEAKSLGVTLDANCIRTLVQRVGMDQWHLWHALQKLVVFDEITPEIIEEVIEPNETENAFGLFEAALSGDTKKVITMLRVLQKTEDPYRLFGLLGGQAFQLAALSVATVPDNEVASHLSVHPFAVSKLSRFARKIGKTGAKQVIAAFAAADADMKSSGVEPWMFIERALLKVATI
jgi:DNA polymerase-3 subunit delta